MALTRLPIEGFGQIELNRVAFSRTGEVEAQCELDSDSFVYDAKKVTSTKAVCENGMLLAVDKAASKIKLPTAELDVIGLNYSAEHMYDTYVKANIGVPAVDWTNSSRYANYYLGVDGGNFLPRIGFLSKGDVFMTNCVSYESDEFADADAVKAAVKACATTALYGVACADGAIKLTATVPTTLLGGLLLKVCNNADKLGGYTMADGQFGVKFQVVKA